MGSGVRLNCTFLHYGFQKERWTTTVTATFPTEAEAYAHEAVLCPLQELSNPYCLNDTVGGRKMQHGSAHARLLKSRRAKPSKKR
jgi:hypothetical protein